MHNLETVFLCFESHKLLKQALVVVFGESQTAETSFGSCVWSHKQLKQALVVVFGESQTAETSFGSCVWRVTNC